MFQIITLQLYNVINVQFYKIILKELLKQNYCTITKPGKIIYLETSWENLYIYVGNKFLFLILDEVKGMIWRIFGNIK